MIPRRGNVTRLPLLARGLGAATDSILRMPVKTYRSPAETRINASTSGHRYQLSASLLRLKVDTPCPERATEWDMQRVGISCHHRERESSALKRLAEIPSKIKEQKQSRFPRGG